MGRRRVLQALGAASVAGLPAWSFAQPTAQVNTTKLAVTDTEVVVGQLHSATGTMAISETGSIQAEQLAIRSEEHTSELQSQSNLVCRLLLEKKKKEARRW